MRFRKKFDSPVKRKPKPKTRSPLELTDRPRLVVFRVLKEVFGEGRHLEAALDSHGRLLSPRDLGLATALVYEIVRHRTYLNWLFQSRLSDNRASTDLSLVLQIGLAQLLYFDRLGEHAIVSETVNLAKQLSPGRQGVVNAILRGLIREREAGEVWPPQPPKSHDPAADLAITYSYQPFMVRRIIDRLGLEEGRTLLEAANKSTPPTIRINPRRVSRAELQAQLPFATIPTELSPWGLRSDQFSGRPDQWPGYLEGLWAVQDEASQLVGLWAEGLAAEAKILDVCAGLGGKALHLAAQLSEGQVFALDKDQLKLDQLQMEARRLDLSNVHSKVRDLMAGEDLPSQFDLVLVDAPCSGLGVIRRRPDLKWNKSEDDIARLARLQDNMLARAARAVKAGGLLLYGVCSFSEEEGPMVAKSFLAAQPQFGPVAKEKWPLALQPLLDQENFLTLWPQRQGCDGFFWAAFRRLSD